MLPPRNAGRDDGEEVMQKGTSDVRQKEKGSCQKREIQAIRPSHIVDPSIGLIWINPQADQNGFS